MGAKRAGCSNPLHQARKRPRGQAVVWRKFGIGERLFATYYKQQLGPCGEGVWGECRARLSVPLPLTVRIHAGVHHKRAKDLIADLRGFGATTLPWVADDRSWCLQMAAMDSDSGRACARAVIHDAAGKGLAVRQEAVSALPVVALEVRPGQRVIDLCASPGMKTMQTLELLEKAPSDQPGLLVANDAHPLRLQTLGDTLRRHGNRAMRASGAHLVLTCHGAERFPLPPTAAELFDRVLADVPCSGDGTIRKDPRQLQLWEPEVALALHSTQCGILKRAVELLAPGGRLVYSTCSLNPVENEAVVAATLAHVGEENGSADVTLVDAHELLAAIGVPCRHGLATWRVARTADRGKGEAGSADESGSDGEDVGIGLAWAEKPVAGDRHTPRTAWPPDDRRLAASLERCARFLPCDHESFGGFFIAVLERGKAPRAAALHDRPREKASATGGGLLPLEPTGRNRHAMAGIVPHTLEARCFEPATASPTARAPKVVLGPPTTVLSREYSRRLEIRWAGPELVVASAGAAGGLRASHHAIAALARSRDPAFSHFPTVTLGAGRVHRLLVLGKLKLGRSSSLRKGVESALGEDAPHGAAIAIVTRGCSMLVVGAWLSRGKALRIAPDLDATDRKRLGRLARRVHALAGRNPLARSAC